MPDDQIRCETCGKVGATYSRRLGNLCSACREEELEYEAYCMDRRELENPY